MPSPIASAAGSVSAGRWPTRYTLIALCVLATFVCYIDRVNISVAVLAMQEEFGWTETTKGLVLSSFFVGYMTFMPVSGWLANRFGGRRVLGFAVLWWSIWTILTPIAAGMSFAMLIIARIAMGAGEAATFPGVYNLYGRWVPQTERSRAVAFLTAGIPLGTLFALTATGWMVADFGWPVVFYSFGLVGIFWCLAWFPLVRDYPREHPRISAEEREMLEAAAPQESSRDPVPWGRLLRAPAVWALIINHLCTNWVFYILLAWLPSYFRGALGLTLTQSGLYAAGPWVAMFTVGTLSGYVADAIVRRGVSLTAVRKTMQVIGLSGAACFMLAARDVTSPDVAFGLMCGALGTLALTWAGFLPNHLEIAPRYADVLMGITNTAGTLPGVIGVAITGWMVEATGTYDAAFLLAAGVNLFGAVVWLFFGTARKVID